MANINRRLMRFVAVVVCAGAGVGVVGALGATRATVATSHNRTLGSILVSSSGRTLYHYLGDKGKTIGCTGSCATEWPPLLLTGSAKTVVGDGLTASKLGTIKRPDGSIQVTYNRLPLYRFAGDVKAGQTNGEGIASSWYAVAPSGALVKSALSTGANTPAPTSPATTTPLSTTPTTTTSSDGGYGY
jgi:predicted lipoprotein with Yx(FWY)xxD motif